jgi:hypothetical protein
MSSLKAGRGASRKGKWRERTEDDTCRRKVLCLRPQVLDGGVELLKHDADLIATFRTCSIRLKVYLHVV